eukprot:403345301
MNSLDQSNSFFIKQLQKNESNQNEGGQEFNMNLKQKILDILQDYQKYFKEKWVTIYGQFKNSDAKLALEEYLKALDVKISLIKLSNKAQYTKNLWKFDNEALKKTLEIKDDLQNIITLNSLRISTVDNLKGNLKAYKPISFRQEGETYDQQQVLSVHSIDNYLYISLSYRLIIIPDITNDYQVNIRYLDKVPLQDERVYQDSRSTPQELLYQNCQDEDNKIQNISKENSNLLNEIPQIVYKGSIIGAESLCNSRYLIMTSNMILLFKVTSKKSRLIKQIEIQQSSMNSMSIYEKHQQKVFINICKQKSYYLINFKKQSNILISKRIGYGDLFPAHIAKINNSLRYEPALVMLLGGYRLFDMFNREQIKHHFDDDVINYQTKKTALQHELSKKKVCFIKTKQDDNVLAFIFSQVSQVEFMN